MSSLNSRFMFVAYKWVGVLHTSQAIVCKLLGVSSHKISKFQTKN